MCNPAFMAMGTTAIGSGVQAYGDVASGKASAKYYNFLAGQNNEEAEAVEKAGVSDISSVQTQAAETQQQKDRETARVEGTQRAALAASGVGGGSGTSEDIAKDTATTAARDAAAIRYDADIKSYQIAREAEFKAKALRDQADQFGQAGVNAARAGGIGAVSSLLNGATQVTGQWYKLNQTSAGAKVPKLQ